MNLHEQMTADVDDGRVAAADAHCHELLAQMRISEWWARADMVESFPADDETAVRLCRAVDYEIDLESLIRFIDVAAFDGVSFSDGERRWSARDIVRLAVFLECRRSWKPGSELHESKLTACEKALHLFRETGQECELFADLDRYDLRSLLLMLTEAESRQQREILRTAVQCKLDSFHIES